MTFWHSPWLTFGRLKSHKTHHKKNIRIHERESEMSFFSHNNKKKESRFDSYSIQGTPHKNDFFTRKAHRESKSLRLRMRSTRGMAAHSSIRNYDKQSIWGRVEEEEKKNFPLILNSEIYILRCCARSCTKKLYSHTNTREILKHFGLNFFSSYIFRTIRRGIKLYSYHFWYFLLLSALHSSSSQRLIDLILLFRRHF